MALNNFTDAEAIERVIALRDRLKVNHELPLVEQWADKDALAQVINLAVKAEQIRKETAREIYTRACASEDCWANIVELDELVEIVKDYGVEVKEVEEEE